MQGDSRGARSRAAQEGVGDVARGMPVLQPSQRHFHCRHVAPHVLHSAGQTKSPSRSAIAHVNVCVLGGRGAAI